MFANITGRTGILGLIGMPLAHSVSPEMHNAALAAMGLDHCYVPFPVQPGRLGEAILGLKALGVRGVNVTLPLKEGVLSFVDRFSDTVRKLGASNTLIFEPDGGVSAESTDMGAFRRAQLETVVLVLERAKSCGSWGRWRCQGRSSGFPPSACSCRSRGRRRTRLPVQR
ncbi:MAG: hypothetical protein HYU64_11135 [Armatimonadetes bacterium]|nr:hypothetical protein [Armatimonadota bacterium]